ncbi:hypothetical protein [Acaricomes phytoseiuli]|uniref:hypothetical protein n=1 Tax=Acaricomes phytoseiuli TaxID=291968 RepID=UPI00037D9F2E|nr:hypothetical protein [Acaricomes phytoseiuli]
MTTTPKTIIGIDLSLTSTGIATLHNGQITLNTFRTKGTKNDTWKQRADRIINTSHQIAGSVPPGATVAIEAPAYASTTGSQHDRSGLWWYTYTTLHHGFGCPIIAITPAQRMIYATGKGNTTKDQVLAATIRRYPQANITNNDEADALILAAITARLHNNPIENQPLPQTHLRALNKLQENPK